MVVTPDTHDRRARLLNAARRRAAIDHPHLLRARVGRDAHGQVGMVMERCSAPRLSQLVSAGALTPSASIVVVGSVASAVHTLTSHGLVARDLTPDRILVHRRAGVLLADHGIPLDLVGRGTQADDPWLAYRSPEELKGRTPDERSSVYSLGAILLLCVTGAEPPDPRVPAPRRRIPGVSTALEKVIRRAMARQPGRRYPNSVALARAAYAAVRRGEHAENGRASAEPEPSATRRPPRRVGRDTAQGAPSDGSPHLKQAGRPSPLVEALSRPRAVAALAPGGSSHGETPALIVTLKNGGRSSAPPSERHAAGTQANRPPQHGRGSVARAKRAHTAERAARRAIRATRTSLTHCTDTGRSALARARGPAGSPTARDAFRAQTMMLTTLGLLAAAGALGTQVISDDETPPRPFTMSAGALSVRIPPGWRQTSLPEGRFGSLSESLAAAPAGRGDVALTVGVIREPVPAESELSSLWPAGSEAVTARLGRLQVSRYAGTPAGRGMTGTAYVLHTTGPSVLITCRAPVGDRALAACARAASTVRLRGERPVPPAVMERRAQAVRATLSTLSAERLVARRRIAAAPLADEQAALARGLQLSYEKAWGRVLETGMPGAEIGDLLTGLGDAAAAYRAVATAISRGDQPGYDEARTAVEQAEQVVWGSAAELAVRDAGDTSATDQP